MDLSWSLLWEGRKNRALPQPAEGQRRPSQGKAGTHHAIPKLTVLYGSELGQKLGTGLVTMKKYEKMQYKMTKTFTSLTFLFVHVL